MKKCKSCNNLLPDDVKFCAYCGNNDFDEVKSSNKRTAEGQKKSRKNEKRPGVFGEIDRKWLFAIAGITVAVVLAVILMLVIGLVSPKENSIAALVAKTESSKEEMLSEDVKSGETEEYKYDYYNGTAIITEYKLDEDSVIVPESIDGNVVISISDAFRRNDKIQSIVLPETIESIDSRAFDACVSLKEIIIPATVSDISADAFFDTPWYKGLEGENGLCIVGDGVLIKSVQVGDLFLPSNVKYIADYTFWDQENLTSITASHSILGIGSYAFAGSGITDCSLLYEKIEAGAFNDTPLLEYAAIYLALDAIPEGHPFGHYSHWNETDYKQALQLLQEKKVKITDIADLFVRMELNGEYTLGIYVGGILAAEIKSYLPKTVYVPEDILVADFSNSSAVENIILSEYTDIPEGAFDGCGFLVNLVIPEQHFHRERVSAEPVLNELEIDTAMPKQTVVISNNTNAKKYAEKKGCLCVPIELRYIDDPLKIFHTLMGTSWTVSDVTTITRGFRIIDGAEEGDIIDFSGMTSFHLYEQEDDFDTVCEVKYLTNGNLLLDKKEFAVQIESGILILNCVTDGMQIELTPLGEPSVLEGRWDSRYWSRTNEDLLKTYSQHVRKQYEVYFGQNCESFAEDGEELIDTFLIDVNCDGIEELLSVILIPIGVGEESYVDEIKIKLFAMTNNGVEQIDETDPISGNAAFSVIYARGKDDGSIILTSSWDEGDEQLAEYRYSGIGTFYCETELDSCTSSYCSVSVSKMPRPLILNEEYMSNPSFEEWEDELYIYDEYNEEYGSMYYHSNMEAVNDVIQYAGIGIKEESSNKWTSDAFYPLNGYEIYKLADILPTNGNTYFEGEEMLKQIIVYDELENIGNKQTCIKCGKAFFANTLTPEGEIKDVIDRTCPNCTRDVIPLPVTEEGLERSIYIAYKDAIESNYWVRYTDSELADLPKSEYEGLCLGDFCIYDMNKDGTEELIISAGTSMANNSITVFTYDEGNVVLIGSIGAASGTIFGSQSNTGIIVSEYHGGACSEAYLDIVDENLTGIDYVEYSEDEPGSEVVSIINKGGWKSLISYSLADAESILK